MRAVDRGIDHRVINRCVSPWDAAISCLMSLGRSFHFGVQGSKINKSPLPDFRNATFATSRYRCFATPFDSFCVGGCSHCSLHICSIDSGFQFTKACYDRQTDSGRSGNNAESFVSGESRRRVNIPDMQDSSPELENTWIFG